MPFWRQYRFLRSSHRHILLTRISLIILLIPLLTLCFFMLLVYASSAYKAILSHGFISLSGVLFASGAVMVAFPFMYLVFLFLPISFKKNLIFVRWIFLFRIYKRSGVLPVHVLNWLN